MIRACAAHTANRVRLYLPAVFTAALLLPAVVESQATSAPKKYTTADVAFMQGMIGHHAQALEMTALIAARSTRKDVALLGERISVSQRDEIRMMSEWLSSHGETVPVLNTPTAGSMSTKDHATMNRAVTSPDEHIMPGMLSVAQMDSLRTSRAASFDQTFLRYMIQHHEGALLMVKQLFATPAAAQDPQIFTFATDVDNDQRAEISRMKFLRGRRAIQPPSTPIPQ